MSFVRMSLSTKLRTLSRLLQYNLVSAKIQYNKVLMIQQNNFFLSRRILLEESGETPMDRDKKDEAEKQKLGSIQPKLQVIFTCKKCDTRCSKIISKLAYEKGVVIVRCDGCKNNHLIADNLGWFQDSSCRNIETILKKKGENVRRIRNDQDGYFEAVVDETLKAQNQLKSKLSKGELIEQEYQNEKLKYEKV